MWITAVVVQGREGQRPDGNSSSLGGKISYVVPKVEDREEECGGRVEGGRVCVEGGERMEGKECV